MNKKEFMEKINPYQQILIEKEFNCVVIEASFDKQNILMQNCEDGSMFSYNIDTLFDLYQAGEVKFID